MATLQELQSALVAADKAGATDDARALAGAIMKLRSQPAQEAPQQKPEVEVPGIGETLLIGAGRTFDRVGKGMQQLYYGATDNAKELAALKTRADDDDRAYKPLQEARPFATGIGESLPSMVIPGGGATSWAANALRMGASAAVPAMLEYGDAGDRLLKGLIAGGSAAAIPVLGAAAKSAKTFLEPLYSGGRDAIVGRTLNRIAGDDAANVIQRLKTAQPLVPGSMPTAAQVAENGGIAAMQRSAAAANPSEFAQRGMEQASARLNALRGIAGDDASISAAVKAREAVTKPSYDAAKAAVYEIDPSMQMTMQTPIMQKAIARAKQLAENNERPFMFSTQTSAPFSGVGGGQAQVKRQITGQGLQDIKTALDDLLLDPTSGIVGSEAKTVDRVRGRLMDWMETQNPEFKAARTTYAQMSQPINQMQVGQALVDKLKPALSDYGALGKETAANFAGQLRNSDNLMQNATGFKGIGSLESVMGPKNMGSLNGIAQDLARKSNAESLGQGGGSDTFQKLAMQNIAEQAGMPRLVGGLLDLPVVSRATKWVYRDSDEAAQKVIAEAMLSPAKAAQLMEQVDKGMLQNSPKLKQALLQSGMRVGGLLGMATVPQE
jgi:hypothetical protein